LEGSQNLVEVGDYDQPDHANAKASEAGIEHQASREPDRPRVTPLHRQAEITSHPGESSETPAQTAESSLTSTAARGSTAVPECGTATPTRLPNDGGCGGRWRELV